MKTIDEAKNITMDTLDNALAADNPRQSLKDVAYGLITLGGQRRVIGNNIIRSLSHNEELEDIVEDQRIPMMKAEHNECFAGMKPLDKTLFVMDAFNNSIKVMRAMALQPKFNRSLTSAHLTTIAAHGRSVGYPAMAVAAEKELEAGISKDSWGRVGLAYARENEEKNMGINRKAAPVSL